MIFKKDNVISENISDIIDMTYNEKGIISKKGLVNLTTTRKKLEFAGRKESTLEIYKDYSNSFERSYFFPK
jgi:hypothetical protein